MILRITGYVLVACAIGIVLMVAYRNSEHSTRTLQFSPEQMLTALWNQYKLNNLEPGTYRTVDKERGNVTTSEGQSYTMLRAAWMGDKPTFDASWQWTEAHLAHEDDRLFAWLWGRRSNGTYGVLTEQNGQNSATDADSNIALALIFAYARWQDENYLSAAREIIGDIWDKETLTVGGKTYVLANNIEKFSASETALINPSYLSPATYRIFAQVDREHPWLSAVEGSYDAIQASAVRAGNDDVRLPPNWIAINKTTGAFTKSEVPGTDMNFGYDAMRVPWNLALDWVWFREPRAVATAKMFEALSEKWETEGKLVAAYLPTGEPVPNYDYETPAMYGGAIGYFMLADPGEATKIYDTKLAYLFTTDWSGWRQGLSYYDDNWAWFGIGLYANLLPNLAEDLPDSFFAQSR